MCVPTFFGAKHLGCYCDIYHHKYYPSLPAHTHAHAHLSASLSLSVFIFCHSLPAVINEYTSVGMFVCMNVCIQISSQFQTVLSSLLTFDNIANGNNSNNNDNNCCIDAHTVTAVAMIIAHTYSIDTTVREGRE